jgi:hypothetical protein
LLGIFNLLPLLKGWEYKTHVASRTNVIRGANPIEVLRIDEMGWVTSIVELTSDAYGTVMIDFQGADLQTYSYSIYPESYRVLGTLAQDPAGWLPKYFRPNPNSTAGLYYTVALTSGFQGSLYPYVPSVAVKLYLPNESTQASADIQGYAGVVAITDKKLFIQSLRRVLDPKASLKIDPALLTIGSAQFAEAKEQ